MGLKDQRKAGSPGILVLCDAAAHQEVGASALPDSQLFLLTGMMFLIPTILAYTAFRYWVFRGKVTGGTEHH
jgi:hypothetical protein